MIRRYDGMLVWQATTSAIRRLQAKLRPRMPEADIWRAALSMTRCFRRDAASQAAACADDLLAAGEDDGCAMWKRIMTAIELLQPPSPAKGAAVH